jgi:hypothetical protein
MLSHIHIQWVPTEQHRHHLADIFTKPVTPGDLERLQVGLGLSAYASVTMHGHA